MNASESTSLSMMAHPGHIETKRKMFKKCLHASKEELQRLAEGEIHIKDEESLCDCLEVAFAIHKYDHQQMSHIVNEHNKLTCAYFALLILCDHAEHKDLKYFLESIDAQ